MYYLIVNLGTLVFPHIHVLDHGGYTDNNFSSENIILYLLFLPNIAIYVPLIAQTWSVGVEEQFYLIWPLLMKYVKNKYLLFIGIICIYFLLSHGIGLFADISIFRLFQKIIIWFRIDCMAIGALFALILYKQEKILFILYSKYIQFFTYSTIIVLLASRIVIPIIYFQIFAVLFGIIILNLESNEKTIISLNGKRFNYLGRISYGLYMYHPIAIILVLKVLSYADLNYVLIQYVFSLLLTVVMAHLSYNLYEKKFIEMKDKFSTVLSGHSDIKTVTNKIKCQ